MNQDPQKHIVISHRNEEKAFMLRLFFALKGFKAEIQKSIDQALFSNSTSGPETVLICDASDQTLLRASKHSKSLQNVLVIREGGPNASDISETDARVIPASTAGQDLIDAVSDFNVRS